MKGKINIRWNTELEEFEVNKIGSFRSRFFTLEKLMELQKPIYDLWKQTKNKNLERVYLDTELMRGELISREIK